jgi:hypothetical protein
MGALGEGNIGSFMAWSDGGGGVAPLGLTFVVAGAEGEFISTIRAILERHFTGSRVKTKKYGRMVY